MKKLLVTLLLVAVSWALAGAPAQAAERTSSTMTLAKKQHHHKKHHKNHKKHANA
jgi:Ni/Co efflux regulator RcnB